MINYELLEWDIGIQVGNGVRIGNGVIIGANATQQLVNFKTETTNDVFISESGTNIFITEDLY